jgi:hypothetical protein
MPIRDFAYGLKLAANHLNGTAADYEQMADRLDKKANRTPAEMSDRRSWVEKAQLLRAQAAQILELK